MNRVTYRLYAGVLGVLIAVTASGRSRVSQPPAFERVLMPFVGETTVANQVWLSQFWARNESVTPIPMFFPFPCQIGEGCPPVLPFELQPDGLFVNPTYAGGAGVFLNIGRGRLHDLAYTLRVQDIAGLSNLVGLTLAGTELPLVPVERFSSTLTILNVPAASGTTIILRVYGATSISTSVSVRISSAKLDGTNSLLTSQTLTLRAGISQYGLDTNPAFAMADLTSTIAGVANQASEGRLTVEVVSDPSHPVWAFVALLQQGDRSFTAITPGR